MSSEIINNITFFENKSCEFYPCHYGLKEINCIFCYCPLYWFECQGDFIILSNGNKDCSGCLMPHLKENFNLIIDKLKKEGF